LQVPQNGSVVLEIKPISPIPWANRNRSAGAGFRVPRDRGQTAEMALQRRELDDANDPAGPAREAGKIKNLVVILVPEEHDVDLEREQRSRFGDVHGVGHDGEVSPATDGGEALRAQLTLMRRNPAAASLVAHASSVPLVVMAMSSKPISGRPPMSAGNPLRTRGSPPVMRSEVTPSPHATRAARRISSKVNSSRCGRNESPSSSMQETQ
jgi:hypothetical protein